MISQEKKQKISDWWELRTGYRQLHALFFHEPILGGSSYAYVFGHVLLFVVIFQAMTGILLALFYSPSTSAAWASVAYIQDKVTLGWFIRGLHSNGASAAMIVVAMHMVQTAIYGAYRKPREVNWMLGVILLVLILAFAQTGYLLPWDQTGYWSTGIVIGLIESVPLFGDSLKEAVQGGNTYGNLTLTRFFAIHVLILPVLFVAVLLGHIALTRKHRTTPPSWKSPEKLARLAEPFWPSQVFKNMVAIAFTFILIVAATWMKHGIELYAPADPASFFDARPEWYFRPLFQVLKYVDGIWEVIVSLLLPLAVIAILFATPFLDHNVEKSLRARWKILTVFMMGLVAFVGLLVVSFYDDRVNESFQRRMQIAEKQADDARKFAYTYGVPDAGGVSVFTLDPLYEGKQIWRKHCKSCHVGTERQGPEIIMGYNSRAWIRDFLLRPNHDRFFGLTSIKGMDPVEMNEHSLESVIEFIYRETGAHDVNDKLATMGERYFDDENCSNCHSRDWETEGEEGPNLGKRGSVEMLIEFIMNPSHPRWFGEKNEMPTNDLSLKETKAVVHYLMSLQHPEDSFHHHGDR